MKKLRTVAAKASKKISQQKLTVGLDLGDRSRCHYRDGTQAGGVVASPLGERRSLRTVAQPPNHSDRNGVTTNGKKQNQNRSTKRKRQKPKPSSGDSVNRLAQVQLSRAESQGANQMAAPAATRTPNCTERPRSLLESADGSMASVATRQEKNLVCENNKQFHLTPTGLLMEGVYTNYTRIGPVAECDPRVLW